MLVGLLVAVVLTRVGPLARSRRPAAVFAGSAVLTADEHRAQAQAAAEQGRWAEAVRERLRAVVRELEARGALDPRPGRTAGEVARDGGAAVPDVAADLPARPCCSTRSGTAAGRPTRRRTPCWSRSTTACRERRPAVP